MLVFWILLVVFGFRTRDIADAITETGVEIAKAEVRLPLGALRETGEFDIAIHLHPDVDISIKVVVIAEA